MLRRKVGKDGSRPAFTLIELLVVVAIIALLISILLPSLQRARELSKRAVCQSNLKNMGTSFYTYGNEFAESWPICPAAPAITDPLLTDVTYIQGTGGSTFAPTIGYKRGSAGAPLAGDIAWATDSAGPWSTTRNIWTLVRMSISTPKLFNCPSDTDSAGNQDQSPQDFWDFGYGNVGGSLGTTDGNRSLGYKQCSYGYQVPYGAKGKPSSDRDQRMVLAADRGPYSPVYENGTSWPSTTITGTPNPAGASGSYHLASSDDWKMWNSPNHGGMGTGEGQNILYAGGSAEWQGKPCVGIGFDNIYTSWTSPGTANDQRTLGRFPGGASLGTATGSGLVAPLSDTDSMIYP